MIDPNMIIDIDLEKMLVMESIGLAPFDDNYTHIKFHYFINPSIFGSFINKIREKINNRKCPDDRWEPWECRVNGIFSDEKCTKVIESRLKRHEFTFIGQPIF